MKSLFQRLAGGDRRSAGATTGPRITLAAFGKHPGWDDYLGKGVDTGIGVDTEVLVQVKDALHARGIRGQMDSGAWNKLPAEKWLEGFDHTFLWLRSGHVILGQLWSSTDGKRREYPMVVCADGQGVSPELMLTKVRSELVRLREACLATNSAEVATVVCRAANDRLQTLVANPARGEGAMSVEARQRFLERPEFGPDRLGLLRVMHELESAAGNFHRGSASRTAVTDVRPSHIRMPLGSDSRSDSLLLWLAFLRRVLPAGVPLLFLCRNNVAWMDLIIGEPANDDFFCLQASLQALPLATDIPYEFGPELKLRLQERETAFLAAGNTTYVGETPPKVAAPPPAVTTVNKPAAIPSSGRKWGFIIGAVVVLLIAAIGSWLLIGGRSSPSTERPVVLPQPHPSPATNAPNVATESQYGTTMKAAQAAMERKDYANAMTLAANALELKPNDPAALELKTATKAQAELATATERQNNYETAMRGGREAFDRKDFTGAIAELNVALSLRTNDLVATELKQRAAAEKEKMELAAAAEREQQQKYETALKAGQAAFNQKDYTGALTEANAALGLKPDDPVATKLKTDASVRQREMEMQAEQKRQYQQAMTAGQAAFDRKDYSGAVTHADKALALQKNDPAAAALKQQASSMIPAVSPTTSSAVSAEVVSTTPLPRRQSGVVTNSVGMQFVWIQGLGASGAYVGKYEVTQKEFREVMGNLPAGQRAEGDDLPVANVPYEDAEKFCELLSKKEGRRYALPSPTEWLAAAGLSPEQVKEAWSILAGKGTLDIEVTSWKRSSVLKSPAKVGSLGVQDNGLSDLFGNVREWVTERESAGFSYDSEGVGSRKQLFAAEASLPRITGFRCVLFVSVNGSTTGQGFP